jgi:ACT domain-containing protein
MSVDMNGASKSFGTVADELEEIGKGMGLVIKCQKEEIFDQMHRI